MKSKKVTRHMRGVCVAKKHRHARGGGGGLGDCVRYPAVEMADSNTK